MGPGTPKAVMDSVPYKTTERQDLHIAMRNETKVCLKHKPFYETRNWWKISKSIYK